MNNDKRFIDWNDATRSKKREESLKRVNQIECKREPKINMCGACEYYNEETGECDATPKQIEIINSKYTS